MTVSSQYKYGVSLISCSFPWKKSYVTKNDKLMTRLFTKWWHHIHSLLTVVIFARSCQEYDPIGTIIISTKQTYIHYCDVIMSVTASQVIGVLIVCRFFRRYSNYNYRQISNIKCAFVGNQIIDHSDVVGASPAGAAPTTTSFSTEHMASINWAKTNARRDGEHLSFGIWSAFYWRFDGTYIHCQWGLVSYRFYNINWCW